MFWKLLPLFLLPVLLSAQPQPVVVWQNTIGGSSNDFLWDLKVLPFGKAVLAGFSQSPASGDKTEDSQGGADYWLVRLQDGGELDWQHTIGGSGIDRLTSVQLTSDGGFILAGDSDSPADGDKTEGSQGETDFWVIKTDSLGQIEWQNTIGGNDFEYDAVILVASDSTYLLGGYSSSDASGDKTEDSRGGFDFWVMLLDATGEVIWDKTFGGSEVDYLFTMDQLADGNFVLGGYSDSGASGDKTGVSQGGFDIWVVKIDHEGAILWQKTLGGNDDDWLNELRATADGGCLLGGSSYSGISGNKTSPNQGAGDWWLIKLDSQGAVEWQRGIGGDGQDAVQAIVPDPDGGYLVAGSSASGISGDKILETWGGFDYWLVHVDNTGAIEWQQVYGGDDNDLLLAVQPLGNTAYMVGGYSGSGATGNKSEASQGFNDYWVLYLDELTPTLEAGMARPGWDIRPNPAGDRIWISPGAVYPVEVFDSLGRVLITWEKEEADGFSIAHLPPGIYFAKDAKSVVKLVRN